MARSPSRHSRRCWVACSCDALACQSGCCRGGHSGGDRRGCSQTVGGFRAAGASGMPDPNRSYGYVDDRCGLLLDSSVQETLGADNIVRPYSGAVCQYVLTRGDARPIDVTFSWFETGSLDREKTLAAERGATITGTASNGTRRSWPGGTPPARRARPPRRRARGAELVGPVPRQSAAATRARRRETAVRHPAIGPVMCGAQSGRDAGCVGARRVFPRRLRSSEEAAAPSTPPPSTRRASAAVTATASPTPTSTRPSGRDVHQGRRQRRRLLLAGEHGVRHVRCGHGHLDLVVPRQRHGHRAVAGTAARVARSPNCPSTATKASRPTTTTPAASMSPRTVTSSPGRSRR